MKTLKLFHPESPGVTITVKRSWIGQLFKPAGFATLSEALRANELTFAQKRKALRARGKALRLKRDLEMKADSIEWAYTMCPELTINAYKFLREKEKTLRAYADEL